MQIFLDTADISEIEQALELLPIDGVTTNPSLMAKTGLQQEVVIPQIAELLPGPISAEVLATESDAMIAEGHKLDSLAENIVVKLPMTEDGLRACTALTLEGIQVNMTLIFSVNQAWLAAKAGAAFISPFVGRLDDIGVDGMDLVAQAVQMQKSYPFDSEIIGASIRHPLHVQQAIAVGCDIVTIPFGVLKQLMKHPLTDIGLARFMADAARVVGNQQPFRQV